MELSETNRIVYGCVVRFFSSIVKRDGLGGWSLNTEFIKDLARELEVDSVVEFTHRVQIVVEELMKYRRKEERQGSANK